MDFFGQQDRARRNSGRLVLLFVLAVLLLIAALYAVAVCVVAWQREMQVAGDPVLGEAWRRSEWWWQPDTLLAVSAVVVAVVGGGSLFKIAQLQDGGSGVALRLGGRLVDPGTSDPAERRLVNVVEEMIAMIELAREFDLHMNLLKNAEGNALQANRLLAVS